MLSSRALMALVLGLLPVFAGLAQIAPAPSEQPRSQAPVSSLVADTAPPNPLTTTQAELAPPQRPLTREVRGDIFMARKMYREAIEVYREAANEPENKVAMRRAIMLNKIGIAHHQLTDLGTAKKYYEQALKANKHYAEATNNLGTVCYARKDYKKAIRYYEQALKVSPNSASIYSNLGTAWFARKKYDKAFEAYQKALSIDPEVFEHRSSQGVLLQERSVEERAKFHFYLSKTYAQAGIVDRALQYMRMALEEGFKDRKRFIEDPEFAALQELPEFQALLALQPRVL